MTTPQPPERGHRETVGLHTLAVQNGRRGPAALGVGFSDERAQGVVERRLLMVERPLPEGMIDRLPRGKVGRQITPRKATLDDVKDGIQDAPTIHERASAFGGFGEHRFEVSPLGICKTGVIYGVFTPQLKRRFKLAA